MIKIDLVRPILVLVILALAFGWVWQCESGKKVEQIQDLTAFRTRIDQLRSDSAAAGVRLHEVRSERTERRLKDSVALIGLRIEIRGLRSKLVEARVNIRQVIDSLPLVKRYVQLADSTIAKQDSAIYSLESSLEAEKISNAKEVKELAEIHIKALEENKVYEARVAELQKQVRKQTRRKKFWRSISLILASATAITILAQ